MSETTDGRLNVEPQNLRALVEADLVRARKALGAGRFDQAIAACDRAQARGTAARIFRFHPGIDRLRDDALELKHITEHIAQIVNQADDLAAASAIEDALAALEGVLGEPSLVAFKDLGSAVAEKRDQFLSTRPLAAQIDVIRRSFEAQDFSAAHRMVEALLSQHPGNRELVLWQGRVNRQRDYLHAQLSRVDQGLERGDFQDAVEILRQLRQTWPQNPEAVHYWFRAHLNLGLDRSQAGRLAIQDGTFDAAPTAFEAADQAFQLALQALPGQPLAMAGRDEATALLQMSISSAQVQREQREQLWDAAHQTLGAARASCAEACRVRGHDFGDVVAALDILETQVDQALSAIADARALLVEGQHLLEQGACDRAEDDLRRGLQLVEQYDEALALALLNSIQQAEDQQQEVRSLLEQVRATSDGAQRLQVLTETYARRPGTPGLAGLLVAALLEAAGQASDSGDDARVILLCQQVLDLPEAETSAEQRVQASELAGKSAARQKVAVLLAEADSLQEQLDQVPFPTTSGYSQLVEVLRCAQQEAQHAADCLPRVESLLDLVHDRSERVSRAEGLLANAERLRKGGEWSEAVGQLQGASKLLADMPIAELSRRQEAWQKIALEVDSALQIARGALTGAEERYQAARVDVVESQVSALGVKWTEIQGLLGEAQAALAAPPEGASPLPPIWDQLQAAVNDLATRCQILQQVSEDVRLGRTIGVLDRLAEALNRYPGEPVLVPLRDRLLRDATLEIRQQARAILDQASVHIQVGEWSQAREQLVQVEKLQLVAAETAAERRALHGRLAIGSRIEQLYQAGVLDVQEVSHKERLGALHDLLQAAVNDDSGLPAPIRGTLNDLLGLENAQLYRDASQQTGAQLCDMLATSALENRLVQNFVLSAARTWLNLLGQQASENYIFAQIQLGDYEQAYTVARQAVDRTPENRMFLEQAAEAKQHIQEQLRHSLQVRLARSRELLDQGTLTQSLAGLDSVENSVASLWQHMEQTFPAVIREDTSLIDLQHQVEDLRNVLVELKAVSGELSDLIGQARGLYAGGQLNDAAQKLAEVRLLDHPERVKIKWQEWQALHDTVEAGLRASARARVRALLDRAKLTLDTCTTPEDVQQVLADLEAATSAATQLDHDDGKDLRQSLNDAASSAQGLMIQLASVAYARQTADEAAARQELQQQLAALERAAGAARGKELELLLAEIEHLRPLAEQQRRMRAAWEDARLSLDRGNFKAAYDQLAVSRQLGKPEEEVAPYRETARAGMLLLEAKGLLTSDQRAASARLQKVLEIAVSCPLASVAGAEAQEYLTQIQSDEERRLAEEAMRTQAVARQRQEQEAQRRRLAGLLRGGRSALRQNQLEAARRDLTEVFAIDPDHAEAKELWEQTDRAEQANALVERAEDLHQQGQYDAALGLVKQAFAMHPDMLAAQELPIRLMSEREAGLALARARNLASEKRFMEARAELWTARERNPRHPHLTAAEDEVHGLEERFWESMLKSAEDALGRRDYRAALRTYWDLGAHLEPAEAQIRIMPLRQVAVDQWAAWIKVQAADTLASPAPDMPVLEALQKDLREVLATTPEPAADKCQTLKGLGIQLTEARLRGRLAEGYDALHSGRFSEAGKIGHELEEITAGGDWPMLDFLVVNFSEDVRRAQTQGAAGEGSPSSDGEEPQELSEKEKRLSAEEIDQLYIRAQAALALFDLEHVTRCIATGRQAAPAEERWADMAARLQGLQEIAPRLHRVMETGWDRVHSRDFVVSQAAFASVTNIPSLEEPLRWYQFARHVQQAIGLVSLLEHESAASHLAEAEILLRIRPGESLSPLWGERLLTERRWGVFYAQTLREEVTSMITDKRLKDRLKAQNNSAGAAEVLRSLIQRQEHFLEFVKAAIEPPADFSAAAVESEAFQE